MRRLLGCSIVPSNILTPPYSRPSSETVHGAVDPFPSSVQYVGIDHCRLHVLMPEQFLNRADIIAIFQEVRGERVSQRVAAHRLGQAGLSGRFFDGRLSD